MVGLMFGGREGFVRVWGLKSTKCVVAGFVVWVVGWRGGGGLWVLVVVRWWAWCLFGVVLWRRGFCLGFGFEKYGDTVTVRWSEYTWLDLVWQQ